MLRKNETQNNWLRLGRRADNEANYEIPNNNNNSNNKNNNNNNKRQT